MTKCETKKPTVAIVVSAVVMLAGCTQPTTPSQTTPSSDGRIDVATATHLVQTCLSQQSATSASTSSLEELTTDEVFERMGLQVFIDTGTDYTSYVIKRGRVAELCEGSGGFGLQSMCVADLDANRSLELVFTYSWGSGVHRSHVGICYDDGMSLQTAIAPFCYYGDLLVEREDDQHVSVVVGEYRWDGHQAVLGNFTPIADFGEVRIEDQEGTVLCRVLESGTLPDELRELIDPPHFVNALSEDGEYTPLAPTIHLAQESLFTDYEMATVPESESHGAFWLGDLTLGSDFTYHFEDSGSNLDHRAGQDDNFFMCHPEGKFEIQYPTGVDQDTHLETLEDGMRVATVVFESSDGGARASFDLILNVDDAWMGLRFASDEPLSFRVTGGEDDFMR